MIQTQYATFWNQNLCSVVIYVPILVAAAWIINNDPDQFYPQTVILDNLDFNITMAIIIFTGIVSLALSYKPDFIEKLLCVKEEIDKVEISTVPDKRQR